MTLDYVKRNKIIRSRGYAFEKKIVESILKSEDWNAKRLGGTTTTMPDIIASNVNKSIFLAIECKSTESTHAYILKDQIDRCIMMCEEQPYKHKIVVFAFKFKRKEYVKNNKNRIFPLRYFIFGFSNLKYGQIEHFTCSRIGTPGIMVESKQEGCWKTIVDLKPNLIAYKPEELTSQIESRM